MSKFIVGLTGGIGSGKTTVANLFADLGIVLVDADVVARQVVEPGQPALTEIATHFGLQMLQADGSLNRPLLRERIFSDGAAKSWLDQLLHPLIRQQMLLQLQNAGSPYALLVAPLLIENGLTRVVDQLLVVDIQPETQILRTSLRDKVSQQQVAAIMASQCDRQQRLQLADQIINNDQDAAALPEKVRQLHQVYLALAAEKLAKSLT
ncbi:dephospho-CoA kinase [Rheinheimera riviphila]|uniref:Dephospho-CoA kinase n=1 Tax=Rheinheimera riviphila TaxID=1834037 RepID=A0A437QF90_9GAMM|nr:dephospho-CoA kinase [Rheinheimera riviphila]RVU33115.1 dephospho-CoA kinase [Rheinheimera riviphila]